jgi:anti-sigma factor RsiW
MSKDPLKPESVAELAPFYVVGALSPVEKARFEAALARNPELARNVAAAQAERDEVLGLNESLPAPTQRALKILLERMKDEPASRSLWSRLDLGAALAEMFSPRALGWAAAAACLLVSIEAGVLTLQTAQKGAATYQTASKDQAAIQGGTFALVAFAPAASAENISKLLADSGAQIVEGPRAGGFYRVSLGGTDVAPAEAQRRLDLLRHASALVRFAEPSP